MVTSAQITRKINNTPNPEEAEYKLWKKARYLVAQEPASADYTETTIGYFRGRHVMPGPMADGSLTPKLREVDFQVIKNQYYIRFTDNITTESADQSVGRAIYTIMTDSEADEYEAKLRNERS